MPPNEIPIEEQLRSDTPTSNVCMFIIVDQKMNNRKQIALTSCIVAIGLFYKDYHLLLMYLLSLVCSFIKATLVRYGLMGKYLKEDSL